MTLYTLLLRMIWLRCFRGKGEDHLRIGCLAAAEEVEVCLDATRLVVRHAAIVGSTGAGTTSAVASLLQISLPEAGKRRTSVVIDPHGEYQEHSAIEPPFS